MKKINFLLEYKNNTLVNTISSLSLDDIWVNKDDILLFYKYLQSEIDKLENLDNISWDNFFLPLNKIMLHLEFFHNHFYYYENISGNVNEVSKYDSLDLENISFKVCDVLASLGLKSKFQTHVKNLIKSDIDEDRKEILKVWLKEVLSCDLSREKMIEYNYLFEKLRKNNQLFLKNLSLIEHSENVLFISKKESYKLKGVRKAIIDVGISNATSYGKHDKGYVFILSDGTVDLLLKEIPDKGLRKKIYLHHKRLSGVDRNNFGNNNKVFKKILYIKQKMSLVYDKKNYTELVLSNYLLSSSKQVYNYLDKIECEITPYMENIFSEMRCLAKKDNIRLQPWDMIYYYQKALTAFKRKLNIKSENNKFKKFFPFNQTLRNIFDFVEEKFNISITKVSEKVINKQILFTYLMKDNLSNKTYYLEISPYNNSKKISPLQLKKASFQCVNNKPVSGVIFISLQNEGSYKKEGFLDFQQLLVLMHELGHGLHSFFANSVNYKYADCYNTWDLIELPSQFFEEIVFDTNFLKEISDKKNGILSDELLNNIIEENQLEKIYHLCENINKYKSLLCLYENFKLYTNQYPQEFIDNNNKSIKNNGYIYNVLLDEFMVNDEHLSDYGPSGYIYLFTSIWANKLMNENKLIGENYSGLRNIFENVFNRQEIGQKKFKDVFAKLLNIEDIDIIKYIKKNNNEMRLFGELNV